MKTKPGFFSARHPEDLRRQVRRHHRRSEAESRRRSSARSSATSSKRRRVARGPEKLQQDLERSGSAEAMKPPFIISIASLFIDSISFHSLVRLFSIFVCLAKSRVVWIQHQLQSFLCLGVHNCAMSAASGECKKSQTFLVKGSRYKKTS